MLGIDDDDDENNDNHDDCCAAGRRLRQLLHVLWRVGLNGSSRRIWELLCFALLCFALDLDPAFDLDLPRRQAERRFCAVGNPARMPG
ncbi:hypothetical protein [Pseudomonas fluorescens]|uniref:hypothetical protein n=1 Tax=Pseudomonas fluorescens TaxID=294 RepID=UPI00177BC9AE|nr:hypothetical protein [Pseudomonas fluorescens]